MKYILTRLQRIIDKTNTTNYSELVAWIPIMGTNMVPVEAGKYVYLEDDPKDRPWKIISVVGKPQSSEYFENKRNERKFKIKAVK